MSIWNGYLAQQLNPTTAMTDEEARNILYAQQVYMAQHQLGLAQQSASTSVSGNLCSGLGPLAPLMATGGYPSRGLTAGTVLPMPGSSGSTTWIYSGQSNMVGAYSAHHGTSSTAKAAFFRQVRDIESQFVTKFVAGRRGDELPDYDDAIIKMLDERRFDWKKVNLTAFVGFMVANEYKAIDSAVESIEEYGVEFEE